MNSIKCERCNSNIQEKDYEEHIYDCFAHDSRNTILRNVFHHPEIDQASLTKNIKCVYCDKYIIGYNYEYHIKKHEVLEQSYIGQGLPKNIYNDRNALSQSRIFPSNDIVIESDDVIASKLAMEINKDTYEKDKLMAEALSKQSNHKPYSFINFNNLFQPLTEIVFPQREERQSNYILERNIVPIRFRQSHNHIENLGSYEDLLRLDENNVKKSLKKEVLEVLPEESMTLTKISKLSKDDITCTICQNEFKVQEKFIRLPCFHIFHSEEIRQWFESEKTCPICKIDIESEINK